MKRCQDAGVRRDSRRHHRQQDRSARRAALGGRAGVFEGRTHRDGDHGGRHAASPTGLPTTRAAADRRSGPDSSERLAEVLVDGLRADRTRLIQSRACRDCPCIAASLILHAVTAEAPTPRRSRRTWRTRQRAPRHQVLRSRPDRTVTFRLRAPEATDVKVGGDFVRAPDMKKADDGVWSVRGPPRPRHLQLQFPCQRRQRARSREPVIQLGERGTSSMFEVPGRKARALRHAGCPARHRPRELVSSRKRSACRRRIDVYTPARLRNSARQLSRAVSAPRLRRHRRRLGRRSAAPI